MFRLDDAVKHGVWGVFFVIILCANALALSGAELAQLVYDRDDGDDAIFKTEMILIDKNSNERVRELRTHVKDSDGLVKSYVEFLTPPDIAGTKFLSWENYQADDTQYLYLPALGRARRIVSSQKKLRFVNTDFSYEDMQRRRPDEDDHVISGEREYLGRSVFILESIPKSGTSQYGKRISYIEKESMVTVFIDYYDRKFRRIKEFRVYELTKIDGVWTAMKIEMNDLQAKHRTRMAIISVRYNQGVEDSLFEVRHLED